MNRILRSMTYLLVLAIGVATGLGLALYLQMQVLQMDIIYPAGGMLWA